jgi:hypothetical protein
MEGPRASGAPSLSPDPDDLQEDNAMRRFLKGLLPPAFVFALALVCGGAAAAQDGGGSPRKDARADETNYDVELHLLVNGKGAEGTSKIPQALDGVVRQLKTSLPSADYKLAVTFISRVKDGGSLEVKTVGGSPFSAPQPNPLTPAFFQFTLNDVRLADDPQGGQVVNVRRFSLGVKVPVQTATSAIGGDKQGQSFPVIQYEDTGINTQISVREGEPTLVGTLNTSRPGQLFALVITIKRAGR